MQSRFRTVLRYAGRAALGLVVLIVVAAGIVAWVGGRRVAGPYESPPHAIAVPTDSAAVAEGGRLAAFWGCTGCHGRDAGGRVFFETPLGDRLVAPNLTRVVRELDATELERAVRHGIGPDGASLFGMPAGMFSKISDGDLGKVIAYLRSVRPTADSLPATRHSLMFRLFALMEPRALSAAQVDAAASHPPGPDSLAPSSTHRDTLALGQYLAVTGCPECHGPDLKGSENGPPDLRIAAAYSPAQFDRLVEEGVLLTGPSDGLMSEIATGRIGKLTRAERGALHAYLRTLARE